MVHGIEPPTKASDDHFSAVLPYNVLGDGNCCLHAISVALWGIQDRVGVLRGAMDGMMKSKTLFFRDRQVAATSGCVVWGLVLEFVVEGWCLNALLRAEASFGPSSKTSCLFLCTKSLASCLI